MQDKKATATAPTVAVREPAQECGSRVYLTDDYANYERTAHAAGTDRKCPTRGRRWQRQAVLEVLAARERDELAALSKREIAMRTGLSLRLVDVIVAELVTAGFVLLVVRGGSGQQQLGTLAGRRCNVYQLTPAADDIAERRAWRRVGAWSAELASVLRGNGISECALRLVYAAYLARRSDADSLAWARFDRFVDACHGLASSTVAAAMQVLERVGLIATQRTLARGDKFPRSGAVATSGSKLRKVALPDELAATPRTQSTTSTPAARGVPTPAADGANPRSARSPTPAGRGVTPYDRSTERIIEPGVAGARVTREAGEVIEAIVAAHGSPPVGISARDHELAALAVERLGLRAVVAAVTLGVAAKPRYWNDPKRPSLRWPSSLLRQEALAELVPLGLDALPEDVREAERFARSTDTSSPFVPPTERERTGVAAFLARDSRPAFAMAAAGGAR